MTTLIGFKFQMPYNGTLEIHASKEINEFEIGPNEEIEGITYGIYWNGRKLPWITKTQLDATAIAFGCQYGAMEMQKKWPSLKDGQNENSNSST